MGIYIKGVEMPKGRPVCIIIDPAGQVRRYDLNNDRYADDELFEATHIPDHGDLVDRDALPENRMVFNGVRFIKERFIKEASVVIPSDKERNG